MLPVCFLTCSLVFLMFSLCFFLCVLNAFLVFSSASRCFPSYLCFPLCFHIFLSFRRSLVFFSWVFLCFPMLSDVFQIMFVFLCVFLFSNHFGGLWVGYGFLGFSNVFQCFPVFFLMFPLNSPMFS